MPLKTLWDSWIYYWLYSAWTILSQTNNLSWVAQRSLYAKRNFLKLKVRLFWNKLLLSIRVSSSVGLSVISPNLFLLSQTSPPWKPKAFHQNLHKPFNVHINWLPDVTPPKVQIRVNWRAKTKTHSRQCWCFIALFLQMKTQERLSNMKNQTSFEKAPSQTNSPSRTFPMWATSYTCFRWNNCPSVSLSATSKRLFAFQLLFPPFLWSSTLRENIWKINNTERTEPRLASLSAAAIAPAYFRRVLFLPPSDHGCRLLPVDAVATVTI